MEQKIRGVVKRLDHHCGDDPVLHLASSHGLVVEDNAAGSSRQRVVFRR